MSGDEYGPEGRDPGCTVVVAQSLDYLDRQADAVRVAAFLVLAALRRRFAVSALGCAGLWDAGAALPEALAALRLGAQVVTGAAGHLAVWASLDGACVSHLLVAVRPAA